MKLPMRRLSFAFIFVFLVHVYLWFTAWSILTRAFDKYLNLSPKAVYGLFFQSNQTATLYSDEGRTNFLLIGQGGANHSGGDLSDTLILVSVSHKKEPISLISIPRDVWLKELNAKINAAYEQGEKSSPGYGITKLRQAVSQVTGLPIHYYFQIDFNGFSKLIDALGGVDVEILNSFTDSKYPIPGLENAIPESSRYEVVSFSAGIEHMDGQRILKYVRSRNALGPEGTDLARSARQELVIKAIKVKLLSSSTWQDTSRFSNLFQITQNSLKTDLPNRAFIDLFKVAWNHRRSTILTINIPSYLGSINDHVTKEESLLIHPAITNLYAKQWVLIPKDDDFTQIHEYIHCQIFTNSCN